MKNKLLLFLLIALSTNRINAQWTSRANFPGVARAKATSFTIGDKMYVLGGITNANQVLGDFWEYDMTNDTWTNKGNFPGPERYAAVGFVLGGNGYIATGGNDNGYLDDMWQYDPVNSQWIQRTGLPATQAQHENQRIEAYAFVVNNKAYLGGGNGFVFGANQTNNIAFSDLWEFDPSINTWTMKSGEPDFIGRNLSIAVAINGKGYIGLGCDVDQTTNRMGFWEYDPANDSWLQKSDFPSSFSADCGAFEYANDLYVTGGVRLNPLSLSNQVYKYDIANDTWSALPAFNGGAIAGHVTGSTGARAFVAGGYNSQIATRNDVWEFAANATGIFPVADRNGNIVYPNPASGYFTISSASGIQSVQAFDVNGRLVMDRNSGFEKISLENLNSGIYQLKIKYSDGTVGENRIVKSM